MSREMHHDSCCFCCSANAAPMNVWRHFFSAVAALWLARLLTSEFNLSMSRNDIGNYLGLAVETVSRLFSRLQEDGILVVHSRHVQLCDISRLQALAAL